MLRTDSVIITHKNKKARKIYSLKKSEHCDILYLINLRGTIALEQKNVYYYLSKHRTTLMGIAILCVVWFHSAVETNIFPVNILNSGFTFIKNIGYGGVDIFLLVSGMGIYNSLEKNDISKYIKNRMVRIVPTWWVYLILCIIVGFFAFNISFTKMEILGFATFTGYWLDIKNQGNWYVYAIMLFYLISPVLHSLLKNSKNKKRTMIILVLISLIVSFAFFKNNKLIVFSRLPIYIIGMYVSADLKEPKEKKINYFLVFALFAATLLSMAVLSKYFNDYFWSYGLWWYPYIIIAPTVSLLIAKGIDVSEERINPLIKFIDIFGKSSLEILLVAVYLYNNFKTTIVSKNVTAIIVMLSSLIIGILFHYAIDYSTKLIKKHNKKAFN